MAQTKMSLRPTQLSRWRPRREMPRLWIAFTGHAGLHLTQSQAQHWWAALSAARWSTAVEFRLLILCASERQFLLWDTVRTVFDAYLAPARCIMVLETLLQEGLLSRTDANVYQDQVLRCSDQHGCWCPYQDDPAAGEARTEQRRHGA